MAQGVADRLRQGRLARYAPKLGGKPGVEGFHEWLAALLPGGTSVIGRAAADFGLDGVKLAVPAQRLCR